MAYDSGSELEFQVFSSPGFSARSPNLMNLYCVSNPQKKKQFQLSAGFKS